MKKLFCFAVAAALTLPVAAAEKATPEERANKDYSSWLPAKGDFSVGFSLDPLTTYIGNFFNGNLNNSLGDLGGDPINDVASRLSWGKPIVSIVGTYMLTDNLAAKANIGFGFSVTHNNQYALDEAAAFVDPLSRAKVIDSEHHRKASGSVALGVEYRVGKTRPVQGVFGAGANYSFGSYSRTYTYGNAITELIQVPDIAIGTYEAVSGYMPKARVLSVQNPELVHMVGLYGSVGVEWFVAPKIALGANVNVGLYYAVNPARATTSEGWNIQSMQVEQYTELVAPAEHGFHFGTDNIGSNLYVTFYFR